MTTSDKKLEDFFEEILNKADGSIKIFFNDYPEEKIITHLFSAIISTGDPWKLGRVFGYQKYLTDRYSSVDICIYSWLQISTLDEKKNLLNFLDGYWDNADANLDIVIKISDDTVKSISNNSESAWDNEGILLGVATVAIGYFNNENRFQHEEKLKLKKNLKILKSYALKVAPQSHIHDGLLMGL